MITLALERGSDLPLKATFCPERGMNLIQFSIGDVEMIEKDSGFLVGPHYYKRYPGTLPKLPSGLDIYPEETVGDPFIHGISRYAAWQAEMKGEKLVAKLSSKQEWKGMTLGQLEGQQFEMQMEAFLKPDGLHLFLSVVSESDSIAGVQYFWNLSEGESHIESSVIGEETKPNEWIDRQSHLKLTLGKEKIHQTFRPYEPFVEGKITLRTPRYSMVTKYKSQSQENSWNVYKAEGAKSVSITPLSSLDPRHPNLSASWLKISLEPTLLKAQL